MNKPISIKRFLSYLARATVLGVAVAIVLLLVWPQILHRSANVASTASPAANLTISSPVVAPPPAPTPADTIYNGSGPVSYATAVDRAAPAVVNINTAKVVQVRAHPFFDDPVFREFFGRSNPDLIRPRQKVETSLGSGVILSPDGYIITNNHVIRDADQIQVSLRDGRMTEARVIGIDPETDIAVLQIKLRELPVMPLGDSDALRVGDVVLAIGNPFGVGQTVTMGIVSGTGRSKLGINTFENFIQTDAAINPGNSGGALVNAHGALVGINTAIFSKSGGSQGIGFAIPTSLVRSVMQDIINFGRPQRGWLGVEAHAISPEQARALRLKTGDGVIVVAVMRGGPAHQAGLQPGDVIQAIDDRQIREAHDALIAISRHKPGSRVRMKILRDGREMILEPVAIERPTDINRRG